MKRTIIVITYLVNSILLQAQSLEVKTNGSEKLLGQWPTSKLRTAPYNLWFNENYGEYQPDEKDLKNLSKRMNTFDSVTVFLGTWCGDSRREVPRLIKSLEQIGFDFDRLKLIFVDRTFQNYKQSPGREESGQNIHRVPTIILHNGEREVGRIVESPKETLEQDIIHITKGKDYFEKYSAVTLLNNMFNKQGLQYIKDHQTQIINELKGKVMNKYELNTYGLVLFSSFQLAEANIVYELNKELFPNEPLTHFSLGKFEAMSGEYELAAADLERASELAPDDENILTYLENVRQK
ncbi:MAG: hypothetical protein AAF693_13440 [Bacteroidota bacterium]